MSHPISPLYLTGMALANSSHMSHPISPLYLTGMFFGGGRTILISIQSLLGDPNLDSPLNGHAAAIWHNVPEYKKALNKHKTSHGSERK